MDPQCASAVSAEAIAAGVTSDTDFFDRFSYETRQLAVRHDRAMCEDRYCARCGTSTSGPPLDGNQRAGDVTADCGEPAYESRTYHPLNERVMDLPTSVDGMLTVGRYGGDAYLGAPLKDLMRASVEPDRRGGGSNGRKRTDGCSPDFGVTQGQIIRDIMRYGA